MFSIDYAGVDEHISDIRAQLRFAELMQDELRRLYAQTQSESDPDALALVMRCVHEAESVENSIRWRMKLLGDLLEDMRRVDGEVDRIVLEIEAICSPD